MTKATLSQRGLRYSERRVQILALESPNTPLGTGQPIALDSALASPQQERARLGAQVCGGLARREPFGLVETGHFKGAQKVPETG